MKMRKIVTSVTLTALLAGVILINGCNTWKGAGKDVEKTGDKMQGKK